MSRYPSTNRACKRAAVNEAAHIRSSQSWQAFVPSFGGRDYENWDALSILIGVHLLAARAALLAISVVTSKGAASLAAAQRAIRTDRSFLMLWTAPPSHIVARGADAVIRRTSPAGT
jgi:hypothetical protein